MNTYTKYWFLEGFNLFNKLGRITMMRMCEILEMKNIDKGSTVELINNDHKSIFFLKKGTVKIIDTTTDSVKYIVKKGHIFGELSLYDEHDNIEEQAIALEDCIVCYIESFRMKQIMEKHKSLKNGVLKIYGLRIKKLERRLQDLLYKDSTTRIKEFVIDYIKEFGEQTEKNIIAKNLLTHKDIANLTNTSRQTVSNTLSILRKEGIIDYNTQSISILNTTKQHTIQN
ncbi:Crp/Fnr family transcriptional regulator [Aquimarina sp. AD1]|uniref:Crp/Fnr family transcriptional regulator n=1 Tax=Aquimarina sp. (strain AD1) TaxID=1714848 RepID=UPI000E5065EB|nr:Crp/Fnr family transcriptional regulator [Aquimarina sp. AD1]AXT56610.1 Crp/Fnr family transcriptional regulator [Aquimarina sp. AD1]RKN13666.1 Crp/Fnr family transcriptional regulator [Aquimarina sp. AD1]